MSHANIVANISQLDYHFSPRVEEIRREGRIPRMPAPLANSVAMGVVVQSMMALKTGLQVFPMKKYDFHLFIRYIQHYQMSVVFLAPAIWQRIVNEIPQRKIGSLRFGMSGGSPLPLSIQLKACDMLANGVNVKQSWGMTETVCTAAQFGLGETDQAGSVGRLMPNMEAAIVGQDDKHLGPDETGEILLRGKLVKPLKVRNPDQIQGQTSFRGTSTTQLLRQTLSQPTGGSGLAISESFRKMEECLLLVDLRYPPDESDTPWFHTDVLQEVIKYKGNQVSPTELEGVIMQCPGVADVGVIGVPLPDANELPRAYVVRDSSGSSTCTERAIMEFVAARVTAYKRLRGGVRFVDELPRNVGGKIQREVLREWCKADGQQIADNVPVAARL